MGEWAGGSGWEWEKKASWPVSRILSWCGHSSGRVVSVPLLRPTRNGASDAEVPVWPCSERGLPCRPRCLGRGALLPHLFTLADRGNPRFGRCVFCCAVRRLAAPGGCPAFLLFGVRTFLPAAPCDATRRPPGQLACPNYSASPPDEYNSPMHFFPPCWISASARTRRRAL